MHFNISFIKAKIESSLGLNEVILDGVQDLKNHRENSLSFIADKSYKSQLINFKSGLLLVDQKIYKEIKDNLLEISKLKNTAIVILDNAYINFIAIVKEFFPKLTERSFTPNTANNIHKNVKIHTGVSLGNNISIGSGSIIHSGVTIMDDVSIGLNTIIYPNVVIYNAVKIGDNVNINAGSVIGADGFGFLPIQDTFEKIPHIGTVIIEDNVEIGAQTCIDRGTVSNTIIGAGTKIDNLVQIAHNCIIGKNCILSAMTGLSGSTELGDNVIMAASSGTKGHLKIGSKTFVTARTSVTKDIAESSTVKGYPARDLQEELKIQTLVGKLPNMYKRLNTLEKKVEAKDGKNI